MLSIHPPICRLCLTNENVTVNIFKYQFSYLPKMIHSCLPITITENDSLPKCICQTCHSKVTLLYEFRNQALEAQQHFLSLPLMNQESVPTSLYPEASQHFGPVTATYNEYVPENLYCNQQGYENSNTYAADHAQNFCEVVESNDLPISHHVDTCVSDPLLQESNDGNNFYDSPLRLPERPSDERVESIRIRSVQSKPPNSSQRRNSKATQSFDTESLISLRRRKIGKAENNQAQSAKAELSSPSRRQRQGVIESRKTQSVEVKPSNLSRSQKDETENTKPEPVISNLLSDLPQNAIDGSETRSVEAETRSPSKEVSSCPPKEKRVKGDDEDSSSSDDSVFSCDKCHFTTKSQSSYIMHCKRHIRKYIVYCKECNISFLNKTDMTNHKIEKHDAEQFQCAECNEIFTSKDTLYSHIKSHDPSNVHVCEICGKTYKKKNSYKRHINRNHMGMSAKAQCAICDRILSSKEHLRRHMLVHTDERNWVCATCGKCYRSKCYLTEHTRIHTGVKPHKCEICGKCFTQRGSLTIHKRSHTGERPFRCEFCDRGFIISTLLRYHMKKCSLAPSDIVRTEPVSVITSTNSSVIVQKSVDAVQ